MIKSEGFNSTSHLAGAGRCCGISHHVAIQVYGREYPLSGLSSSFYCCISTINPNDAF